MTTDATTRVLDAGGPLFLHDQPPYHPMPACGRGMCVEMPADIAKPVHSIVVSLRPMERHDGGPAVVELERFQVAVSLDTGQCSPCDDAAERLLAEQPWIPFALTSQLEPLRRRVRRLLAQRDQTLYRTVLDRTQPGEMLAYDRLFPHDWDLIFVHDGHHYWASDQHCPNPACNCREISVVLYNLDTPDAPTVGTLRIGLVTRGPRANPSSHSVDRLFEPLWTEYGPELTRRHNESSTLARIDPGLLVRRGPPDSATEWTAVGPPGGSGPKRR